jgi:hypothetical protein
MEWDGQKLEKFLGKEMENNVERDGTIISTLLSIKENGL